MNKLLILMLFLSGCTLLRNTTVTPSEVQKDALVTTPSMVSAAKPGADSSKNWILLAESVNKDWFYDPSTLVLDGDGYLSFVSFSRDKTTNNLTDRFNLSVMGPYIEKMGCFSNYFMFENVGANIDPVSAVSKTKPAESQIDWAVIKEKTAMAYIRTRLCGRGINDNHAFNYFLYQDEPIPQLNSERLKKSSNSPIFYEVVNNEFLILDSRRNIREMKVLSYLLNKDLTPQSHYFYRADCQNRLDVFALSESNKLAMQPIGESNSLSGVAFNRICENHGSYMRQVSSYSK